MPLIATTPRQARSRPRGHRNHPDGAPSGPSSILTRRSLTGWVSDSTPGSGALVTLRHRTLDEVTLLVRAFGLSTRPDGVQVVTGKSDTVAVRYASGAHVPGVLSVTWVIDGATAALDALNDAGQPRAEE